jgi:glucose uptake protein GlcU
MIGFVLAFISSVFFSLYVVPRKLSKLKPLDFSLLMSIGFFTSSLLLYAFQPVLGFHETISPVLLWSLLAGAIWAASFITFVKAIDAIGLSRSNQWKNLQGPIAAVLSLIFLAEWQTTQPFFVLLAGLAIFASALAFTISDSREQAKANMKGVYLATLAGVGFGTVAVIQKYVTTNVGVYSQQVAWSFAIMLSISLYILITGKKLPKPSLGNRDSRLALAAGLLYLGASFFQLQSYKHLPASIAFTVIQLNTIWTVGIGIIYFKEISVAKHYTRLLVGLVFALGGILLLGFARS